MSVTIEKIDLIKQRANISYSEAQEILTKFDGDVVESLIYLENNKQTFTTLHKEERVKSNRVKCHRGAFRGFIRKLHLTKLVVKNNDNNNLTLPLTIALPLVIFTMPFSLIALGLAAVGGYKINIIKESGKNISINEIVNVVKEKEQTIN